MTVDIYADIIAGKSLGGFSLLERISTYSDVLDHYRRLGEIKYYQASVYSVCYSFLHIPIELNVDIRTGIVYNISALPGYKGKFLDCIALGDSMRDVFTMGLDFEYRDFEMGFFSSKFPGIVLEPDLDDPFPEEIPRVGIGAITVFDDEYIRKGNGLIV